MIDSNDPNDDSELLGTTSDAGHEEEHQHADEGWLVSYADMMTLLFGFFVLMYTLSTLDKDQAQKVLDATEKQFRGEVNKKALAPVQQLVKLRTENIELMSKISKLESVVDQIEVKKIRIDDQIETQKKLQDLSELNQSLEQKNKNLKKIVKKRNKNETRYEITKDAFKKKDNEIQNLKKEIAQINKKKSNKAKLVQKIKDLNKDLLKSKEEKSQLRSEFKQIESVGKKINLEQKEIQKLKNQLKKTKQLLSSQLSSSKSAENIEQELFQSQQDNVKNKTKLQQLEMENAKLKIEKEKIKKLKEQLQQQQQQLQAELPKPKEVAALKDDLSESRRILTRFKQKMKKLVKRIKKQNNQKEINDELKQELQDAERQIASSDSQEQQIQKLKDKLKDSREKQQDLQVQLKDLVKESKGANSKAFLAIFINWSTQDHDVDLVVKDPSGKKFNFKKRKYGGHPGHFALDTRRGPGAELWQSDQIIAGKYEAIYSFYNQYGNKKPAKVSGTIYTSKGGVELKTVELTMSKSRVHRIQFEVSEDGDVKILN